MFVDPEEAGSTCVEAESYVSPSQVWGQIPEEGCAPVFRQSPGQWCDGASHCQYGPGASKQRWLLALWKQRNPPRPPEPLHSTGQGKFS